MYAQMFTGHYFHKFCEVVGLHKNILMNVIYSTLRMYITIINNQAAIRERKKREILFQMAICKFNPTKLRAYMV